MKKNLKLIICFLLINFGLIAQNSNKQIKSICTKDYMDLKNERLDEVNYSSMNCEYFDDLGNLLKKTVFKKDGSFDYEKCSKYKYDLSNNLIKEESYKSDGDVDQIYISTYNNRNDKVKLEIYTFDNVLASRTDYSYIYDLNDSITKETYITKSDFGIDMSDNNFYKYDNNGNKIEHINKELSGEQNYRYTFDYNENGKLMTEIRFNKNNIQKHKSTYERDANGENTEWHYKDIFNNEWIYLSVYDKNGNKIKRSKYDANRDLISTQVFFYDINNYLIKKHHFDSSQKLIKEEIYDITRDKNKNWTEYKTYVNGKLINSTIRIIEYQ